MHRAREIFYGIGIGLLLIGCQPEPDAPKGETGIMPIPESEYELFSDLAQKIQAAEANLNQSLNTLEKQPKCAGANCSSNWNDTGRTVSWMQRNTLSH